MVDPLSIMKAPLTAVSGFGVTMRLAVIGQAPFGEAVLKRLLDDGEEVVAVSAPATPDGGRPDPLRASAEAQGLPVFGTRDFKSDDVFDAYMDLKPDLNVMAFVTDILAERVLFAPPKETIQYHPSLLPKHRGASAMNWAIIQGETKTGLTIFWPDKGIDTGPILLQREVKIEPDDTLGSLYFGKLFEMGVEAIAESVRLINTGKASRIPQDHARATYEGLCRDKESVIDWSKSAQHVYDLVRGCNPQPGAHTTFRGERLKIFDCSLGKVTEGAPGQVVSLSAEQIVVALRGGSLLVRRVQPNGSTKLKVADFVSKSTIEPGEFFGR